MAIFGHFIKFGHFIFADIAYYDDKIVHKYFSQSRMHKKHVVFTGRTLIEM